MRTANRKRLLTAAVAGIALGAGTPASADHKPGHGEAKCYGINGCGAHAKCSVADDDLAAVRQLLGDSEYRARFGKSEAHGCGAHAKCGAASQILNWVPSNGADCKEKGGFLIETVKGKKVAKKA